MKKSIIALWICLLFVALPKNAFTQTEQKLILAQSTFDVNAEGWLVTHDANGAPVGGTAQPTYIASGGNPDGHISAKDDAIGTTWYWQAPDKFLGNIVAAYNQALSFDLKQSSTSNQFNNGDIKLVGGGLTLIYNTTQNPGTDWTHYTVILSETAGWKKAGGSAPTKSEMQAVLSSLTALHIRGEYVYGADTGGLDNVIIEALSPRTIRGLVYHDSNGNGVKNKIPSPDCKADPSAIKLIEVAAPNSPIGIDYHEPTNSVIFSVNYENGGNPRNFERILQDGTVVPFSNISGLTEEVKIATVRSGNVGGFTAGDLFVGTGRDGHIARITDGGNKIINPWVDLPGSNNGLMRGSLYIDQTGVFGGDLIAVTTTGEVWRINSQGAPTKLASLGRHLEGLFVVPNNSQKYGPIAGKIIIGAEQQTLMYVIGADKSVTSYNVGVSIEDIDIIPEHGNFFGVAYGEKKIFGASSAEFSGMAGDILLTQESVAGGTSGLYRLYWDGTKLQAPAIPLAAGSVTTPHWEHVTFASAGLPGVEPLRDEPVIKGRVVYLDVNKNGALDNGELSTKTNSEGTYAFYNLAPGGYTVREQLPANWKNTEPPIGSYSIVFSDEPKTVDNVNFGSIEVSAAKESVVYVNDFEDTSRSMPEWTQKNTEVTPKGSRRFLGQFSNGTVSLGVTNLPQHTELTVSFDLYVIRSWDGNTGGPGPDRFKFGLHGQAPLLDATFSNVSYETQTYPDNSGEHPRATGASEVGTLGYIYNSTKVYGDTVYQISYKIPHTEGSACFDFAASGLEAIGNESWGVDNVTVVANGVALPNIPPVAQDDVATTTVGAAVEVDILANDSDADGSLDPASVVVKTQPPNGMTSVEAATGKITYTPKPGFAGTDTFTYTVKDDKGVASNPATVTVTVTSGVVAPAITSHPQGQTVNVDDEVTFTVVATGTAPLSYQWQKNGNNITGATGASYTIANAALGDAGNYRAVVTNSAGSATSNAAALVVQGGGTDPNAPTVTHSSAGYRAGDEATITGSFAYPAEAKLISLLWKPVLPNGWTVKSVSGDGNPQYQSGEILFTSALTANPVKLSIVASVPEAEEGTKQVTAVVEYQFEGMTNPKETAALPNPLEIVEALHDADYRADFWKIDGSEANRVLAYWRAGAYHCDAEGLDGFAPGAGNSDCVPHSADYRADFWKIDGSEANRVLAYWRAGAYHRDPEGLDGFAPGPGSSALDKASALAADFANDMGSEVEVTHEAGPFYGADSELTVTVTINYTMESEDLLGLLCVPKLPEGWTIGSVSGDGNPELSSGEILWTVGQLPESPIELTYTVLIPGGETGAKLIGNNVEYQLLDEINPVAVRAHSELFGRGVLAEEGKNYQLQKSEDLENWDLLGPVHSGKVGPIALPILLQDGDSQFYRYVIRDDE